LGDTLSGPTHEAVTTGESTVSTEEFRHLTDKYADLDKKCQDLSQQVKYLKRKNEGVMEKNKAMKESVRAWQEYAERQSGKHKPKSRMHVDDGLPRLSAVPELEDIGPHIPSSPGSVATMRTPLSLADLVRSSPAPIQPLTTMDTDVPIASVSPKPCETDESKDTRGRSGSVTPKATVLTQNQQSRHKVFDVDRIHVNAGSHVQSHLQSANPSSSQTTVDEHVEQAPNHTPSLLAVDNDDVPEFVSTRSLKRKRGQPSKIEIYADHSSDGTPIKPFRVKEELPSSPPSAFHSLLRKDTIDLDDLATNLRQTPQQNMQTPSNRSDMPAALRHQRSCSMPLSQNVKSESTRVDLSAIPDAGAADHVHRNAAAELRALSEPSDPILANDILRPIDPNLLAHVAEEPPNKRVQAGSRTNAGLRVLAESGEEPPPGDGFGLRLPPSAARAKLNRRLHLLQDPHSPVRSTSRFLTLSTAISEPGHHHTPSTNSTRTTQTPLAKSRTRQLEEQAQITENDSPANSERSRWTMKAHEPRPSAGKPASEPKKEGPLRSKPASELKVNDFKPNPVYNQGYSYAFSETVRKRGDRLCLPGCTNRQCCGSKFRLLAEAHAPLPPSQEEAMLQDYLGDAYNNMNLTQMSSDERAELVLQARTMKVAKESGKHREAYERRRTPPGFWRVDFPTTQEQQEDRQKAEEQEKTIVQERWREAQRRGGKWIFRDE
jgi:hypothetical protein